MLVYHAICISAFVAGLIYIARTPLTKEELEQTEIKK